MNNDMYERGLEVRKAVIGADYVNKALEVAREEVFGPVLAAIPFDDEGDAVQIANSLPYGLAAGVWA